MECSYYCSAHRGDGLRLLKKIDEGAVEFKKTGKKKRRKAPRVWLEDVVVYRTFIYFLFLRIGNYRYDRIYRYQFL